MSNNRLEIHSELRVLLEPLIAQHGKSNVAFALEGLIAEWVRDEARENLRRNREAAKRESSFSDAETTKTRWGRGVP